MYRCQNCGEVQKPRVKSHRVVVKTRTNEKEHSEIVKEIVVCEKCKTLLEEGGANK